MNNIYWIGPRQSDIEDIEELFAGSITIYGKNQNGNIAFCHNGTRINHNIHNPLCEIFFQTTLEKILQQDKYAKFLFYNQSFAYQYGENILENSICVNSKHILELLNDKVRCRYLLSNIVEVIPHITIKGKDCNYLKFCQLLPHQEFVLQKINSSGGDGTYHITSELDCRKVGTYDIDNEYMLSPYYKDGLSLNIHIIISKNQVVLLPASLQIICEIQLQMLYSGADFICYQSLRQDIKDNVTRTSEQIGFFLQKKGYRGVLGIDYMFYENKLYFMELNARFQASSELINKALIASNQRSIQELNIQAFEKNQILKTDELMVNYSNFVYTTSNISYFRIEKVLTSKEICQIQLDGYCYEDRLPKENNVYLFRSIFSRNICAISHNKVILHSNIYTGNLSHYLKSDAKNFQAYTKFALLNHGITMSDDALHYVRKFGTIKEAVFDAIDITIFKKLKVNVPISCKFNSLSPFTITLRDKNLVLLYEENILSEVQIDLIPNCLVNKKTSSGIPYESIINIATDRIRINPAPICIYKIKGISCHFCNLPEQNEHYNINDILEVIDYCLENVNFRHFLIGGGTYSFEGGWDIISEISRYIRNKCSKDIYLMSIPPMDVMILDRLKSSGITEIAFNIEIFNPTLRKIIMPGKGSIPLEQYFAALEHAVKLWGNSGRVRSLLIYGLDNDDYFLSGINKLCSLGIEPIISIFRPLSGTVLENENPPITSDIFSIYEKCRGITENYSLILGPDCAECQNNTLSFLE